MKYEKKKIAYNGRLPCALSGSPATHKPVAGARRCQRLVSGGQQRSSWSAQPGMRHGNAVKLFQGPSGLMMSAVVDLGTSEAPSWWCCCPSAAAPGRGQSILNRRWRYGPGADCAKAAISERPCAEWNAIRPGEALRFIEAPRRRRDGYPETRRWWDPWRGSGQKQAMHGDISPIKSRNDSGKPNLTTVRPISRPGPIPSADI